MTLTFQGRTAVPAPVLPAIDGFRSQYLGQSSRMEAVGGKVSSSVTHMYTILPEKKGRFTLGPFTFALGDDSYTSNPFSLEIVDESRDRAESGEASDMNERIFMVIQVQKNKARVHEIVPVSVKLYLNGLNIRDIGFPQVRHEGFLLGRFSRPLRYREHIGGLVYEVFEFKTSASGARPGEFKLGPAGLQCNRIVQDEVHPLTVQSPEITFTVLALPAEEDGVPDGMSGYRRTL